MHLQTIKKRILTVLLTAAMGISSLGGMTTIVANAEEVTQTVTADEQTVETIGTDEQTVETTSADEKTEKTVENSEEGVTDETAPVDVTAGTDTTLLETADMEEGLIIGETEEETPADESEEAEDTEGEDEMVGVTAPTINEFEAAKATAVVLTESGVSDTAINSTAGTKWYKISTASDKCTYTFNLARLENTAMYLYVYDESGVNQTSGYSNDSEGKDFPVNLNTGKDYYIAVKGGGSSAKTFKLKYSSEKDYPETLDDAKNDNTCTLTKGSPVTTHIGCGGDIDYFKINTDAENAYYTFSLTNKASTGHYLYLRVFKADGTVVGDWPYVKGATSGEIIYKLDAGTTYYVEVKFRDSTYTGEYTISYTSTPDVGDSAAVASQITVGNSISESICAGKRTNMAADVDYYKITADSDNSAYTFELTNSGTYYSLAMALLDEKENSVITKTVSKSSTNSMIHKLEKGKTYYLKVYADTSYDFQDYKYTLNVTSSGSDVEDTMDTATQIIKRGNTYTENLKATGDEDWYKFPVKSGPIKVTLKTTNADSSEWIHFAVVDSQGAVKASTWVGKGKDSSTTVTIPGKSQYYLRIYRGTDNITGTGEYSFSYTTSVAFNDVSSGWYYDAVDWALNNEITTGATDTTFNPTGNCTRAEVVTFLWRAEGSPAPTITSCPLTDLQHTWYYNAVLWAYEKGITKGKTATTFEPKATVTRAEFVTFLWRAKGQPGSSVANPFTDVGQGYYTNAVLWAYDNGITTGETKTSFGTSKPCTRSAVVTFIYRAYKDTLKEGANEITEADL